MHEKLQKQNLCIHTVRSTVSDFNEDGSLLISCPKLPKDTDARIGVRKDPENPDKTQKIFGYNAILSTSVEIQLGIELPVAISHIPGNADEGSYLINNRKQIQQYHAANVMIDIADAKYDFCILRKPKIRGLKNAGILAQMAIMVLLLKRIIRFIVKVTLAMRKIFSNISPPLKPYITGPNVPKFIANLIQRE